MPVPEIAYSQQECLQKHNFISWSIRIHLSHDLSSQRHLAAVPHWNPQGLTFEKNKQNIKKAAKNNNLRLKPSWLELLCIPGCIGSSPAVIFQETHVVLDYQWHKSCSWENQASLWRRWLDTEYASWRCFEAKRCCAATGCWRSFSRRVAPRRPQHTPGPSLASATFKPAACAKFLFQGLIRTVLNPAVVASLFEALPFTTSNMRHFWVRIHVALLLQEQLEA